VVGLNLNAVLWLVLNLIATSGYSGGNALVLNMVCGVSGRAYLVSAATALVLKPECSLQTEEQAYNKEESNDTSDNYTGDTTSGETLFCVVGDGFSPVAQVRRLNGKSSV
jgi:hypothetical protein